MRALALRAGAVRSARECARRERAWASGASLVRVVAGSARGRRLRSIDRPGLRPTLDRVREALFSILGDLEGSSVLDLFAGTGALGIEALSRGAASAVFVEHDRATVALIRANLESTGLAQRAHVRELALPEGLARLAQDGAPFDLILVDAPYDGDARDRTLAHPLLPRLLAPHGRLVVEHDARRLPPLAIPTLALTDQRRYGSTALAFWEHASTAHEAR